MINAFVWQAALHSEMESALKPHERRSVHVGKSNPALAWEPYLNAYGDDALGPPHPTIGKPSGKRAQACQSVFQGFLERLPAMASARTAGRPR